MPAHMSKEVAVKIDKVLNEFGRSPLHGTVLVDSLNPSPKIVLAMLLDALIKARPISHELTQKTIEKLIEVEYYDIDILSNNGMLTLSTDGDLNNLLQDANCKIDKVGLLLKEVKGIGDLAVEVFFNSVQSVWPSIAPFVDSRSLKTAAEIGIGTDLDEIYNALDRDPMRMSWFANGLSESLRFGWRKGRKQLREFETT
ncbi:FAD dependent oxidoreductase [Penicillium fimorum]|uniref:FAD dependent oxidoreductase n=1 Tax=Penicillium fimorum TaxID=1882269 RepID=A0A9X0C483_9EURO|nr:FAD dependent oxidoreductase [Penicillium fimorum]